VTNGEITTVHITVISVHRRRFMVELLRAAAWRDRNINHRQPIIRRLP
jgi:hypothetical protein